MTAELPQVIHTYQNHTLDSTRWQGYQPRTDDIIITTSYKSGTNWMQEIVRQLIFCGQPVPASADLSVWHISPWIEHTGPPIEDVLNKLNAQQHRRFLKTHLALDGLPFFTQVKYIVVGRDARDVAMSMWNHYSEYKDTAFEHSDNMADQVGEPFPRPPQDVHAFWREWITRGWFPWESEGYPFYGNLHHTQTWWTYRQLANIHFVHYSDLKRDLAGEIRRIADFLTIPLTDETLSPILDAVSLDAMREREGRLNPALQGIWKEGAKTFFFKGTNGRWKDVLSADELQLYDETAAKVLTPDCRAWLERGREAGL